MGIENSFTQRRDAVIDRSQNRVEHPVLKRMHGEAHRILEEGAIDPEEFIDLYGVENVERDLRDVERLKLKFGQNDTKEAATVFEAIVFQHIELSNWLGVGAETIKPPPYDDYINHVDLIVEFNEADSTKHLALGVDVTFGTDPRSLREKFDRIKTEIEKDKLAMVKYFKAHGFRGSLEQLPRVVIGMEISKVINLAGFWERKDVKELNGHIAKDIIVDEIERQLRTFLIYAGSIGAENAVKSYTKALGTVKNIRTLRNGYVENKTRTSIVQDDLVHKGILQELERFRASSRPR